MQGLLSQLRGWHLDHREQDIRGWALRDSEGRLLGIVRELICDTDSKRVREVVLRDGRSFSAHEVWVGDRALMLRDTGQEATLKAAAAAVVTKRKSDKLAGATRKAASAIKRATEKVVEARTRLDTSNDRVVALVDEEIELGKRTIDAGGVRVETHCEVRPIEEKVQLHEERVVVERNRVDRPLSASDASALLHDDTIEMTATSEAPVVDKYAHVVEEIVLKREAADHVERVVEAVRHTDVEITKLNGAKRELQKGHTA